MAALTVKVKDHQTERVVPLEQLILRVNQVSLYSTSRPLQPNRGYNLAV